MLFFIELFLADIDLGLERAHLILLLLEIFSQLFFSPDSFNVLGFVNDRGGWGYPLRNRVYFGLESVFTVYLLLLEFFRRLLSHNILVVEAFNTLGFVFGATLRVCSTNHLTCQIDLRLKAVLSLFCILTS